MGVATAPTVSNKRSLSLKRTRISHGAILLILVVVAALVFLAIGIAGSAIRSLPDRAVIATFCVNLVVGLAALARETARRPFSIMQAHWVFYSIFFVLVPLTQYLQHFVPWAYILNDSDYVLGNVLVMVWGIVFAIVSMWGNNDRRESFEGFQDEFFESLPRVSRSACMVLVLLSLAATVTVVRIVGIEGIFSRGTFLTGIEGALGLIFDRGIRAIPVFAFVLLFVYCKQQKRVTVAIVFAAVLLILAAFPAAMARYNAAAIYGGIALLALRPFMEKRGLFPAFFLVALLLVFPAASVFRTSGFDMGRFFDGIVYALSNLTTGFCTGDYDAYSMLIRSVHYVDQRGLAMGYQLLTAALFFVPRALWAAKGVGTGSMIVTAQGQSFSNVSCPLPAEGIVDFGIAGLVVYAVLAGIICRRLDSWFYGESKGFGRLFYPFTCMLFFFMLRGDLLSSWAYIVGYAVIFAMLAILCRWISDRR